MSGGDPSKFSTRSLDFAGNLGARVNVGIARGRKPPPGDTAVERDRIAEEIFRELADHAEKTGAVIMLEPAPSHEIEYINTMDEAMAWVERVDSPAFTSMLDTYNLMAAERSIEYGIRAARGRASHIHLYDSFAWPPGLLPEKDRLNWPDIVRVLKEEGFKGSGSVVIAPEGDPEVTARRVVTYLRHVFGETREEQK